MMVNYYFLERIEAYFVERWQSKRKTLEISSSQQKTSDTTTTTSPQQTDSTMSSNHPSVKNSLSIQNNEHHCQIRLKTVHNNRDGDDHEQEQEKASQKTINEQPLRQIKLATTMQPCPTLLYASISSLLLMSILLNCSLSPTHHHHHSSSILCQAADVGSIQPPINRPPQPPAMQALQSLASLNLMSLLQKQLSPIMMSSGRERWAHVPSPTPGHIRDPGPRPPIRGIGGGGGGGRILRAINRLGNRIGARNTIRVHNAFRDFAWRILSSLSMPTPVIYEIRRQHLYAPEDDHYNDSLHARNTSRTIRSKRFLDQLKQDMLSPLRIGDAFADKRAHFFEATKRAATSGDDNDEDDDDDETWRGKLRGRLSKLMRPSRRSLLGNALRLPSIFPFKRQEDTGNKQTPARNRRISSFLRLQRKKENDRQMIQIDGKQYYVDDDGKLKELKEGEEIPDEKA